MTRHDTYTGPRPALHAALTALAAAYDPWYGAPDLTETAEQTRDRHAEAYATFRAGLDTLTDRDSVRIAGEFDAEADMFATIAGNPLVTSTEPLYGRVAHAALARLDADAEGVSPGQSTAWCETCRTRRAVVDASQESAYVGAHEVGYYVERLSCAHQRQSAGAVIGASPGGESAAEAIEQDRTRRRLARTADAAATYGDL